MQAELTTMFDENAETYDSVNAVISLGLDARWRKWAARQAVWRPGARVLDAFAGSGAVGIAAGELGAIVTLADASPRMLAVSRRKARSKGLDLKAVEVDLSEPGLPFASRSFDTVTVVFGIRYLDDSVRTLKDLAGLLVPGGRMVIVEFVEPRRTLISALPAAYFFHGIPRIAPLLGGRGGLHVKLAETTHALGTAHDLGAVIARAGLGIVEARMMGFGLVAGLVYTPV
ncbi:MAG: class I SAM-dependent methyltransferase [Coriobacteriia bacterium]